MATQNSFSDGTDEIRSSGAAKTAPPVFPLAKADEQKSIKELAREHAEAAIKVLSEVMNDADAQASARVAASKEILDRAYGKPTQYVEQQTTVTYQGLLQQVEENEQKYKAVVEAQEVKELPAPQPNWDSLI